MNFRYVPVMRYRTQERGVLQQTVFSDKVLPLIEVVSRSLRAGGTTTTLDRISSLSSKIMVGFPLDLRLTSSTRREVANFLGPLQVNPLRVLPLFSSLSNSPNVIPVVTYNPARYASTPTLLSQLAQGLRPTFPQLAFRVFFQGFDQALRELLSLVTADDVLILDIDEAPHTTAVFQPLYAQLIALGADKHCATVLIRSAIPDSLTHVGLVNDAPIPQADNSLLTTYSAYGFSAFGDYAGIKKDLLEDGGTISPGLIYVHVL